MATTDTDAPETPNAPGADPGETPRAPRPIWARIVRLFGMGCLLVAAGVAGYVGWLLWGTGLATQRAQDDLRNRFEGVVDTKPPSKAKPALPGSVYAEIVIPRISVDMMVVQGTAYDDLKKGPGHYPDTADPWDPTGRVGIAGHRTTYLHPFYHLDELRVGDPITLRTEYGTFAYKVLRVFPIPSAGSGRVLAQTDKPTLVLTTCHPPYSSSERLIVTAVRV